MTGLRLLAAGTALILTAVPAVASLCDRAPGARDSSVARDVILKKAREGRAILTREIRSSGATRSRIRVDREIAFDRVSLMHWRWVCDREEGLAGDPELRAEALVQGALFSDLANDLDRLKMWYPNARDGLRDLVSAGAEVPRFWNQPLDRLLGIVKPRLNPSGRAQNQEWFFALDSGSSAGNSGGR